MALDQSAHGAPYTAPQKDLYEVGEMPPLGYVPAQMHAWTIRRERHGEPEQAFQLEVVDCPKPDSNEVLVLVMAAGVNYNGVWAGLGVPISPFDVHKAEFHIAGSDAAGIVWAVGDKVKRWKVGDEVVIHCNQDDGDDEECNGGDPMFSESQRIWGYETPDGSFAQFTCVQSQQLMPRPQHLTWEESACYTLTLATAYRMLFGHRPHILRPGHNVLIWGASGGLGSMAIQICAAAGANAIGVISDESKRDFVMSLGAKGVINRNDFDCWGQLPTVNTPEYNTWLKEARKFGKAIWAITGKGINVDNGWNEVLAEDYKHLHFHISLAEALGRRLRRNYSWIFGVQIISYWGKLAIHPSPAVSWADLYTRAAIGPVDGRIVLLVGAVWYLSLVALALGTLRSQKAVGRAQPHQGDEDLIRKFAG